MKKSKEQLIFIGSGMTLVIVGMFYLLRADKTLGVIFLGSGTTFLALASSFKNKE